MNKNRFYVMLSAAETSLYVKKILRPALDDVENS